MNKEDIIRMAREAGISVFDATKTVVSDQDGLERFAALVAAHEREMCAQLCENLEMHPDQGDCWDIGTIDCAGAIRARSNT